MTSCTATGTSASSNLALVEALVHAPFDRALFNASEYISEVFETAIPKRPQPAQEVFLALRGRIMEQLHCLTLAETVSDDPLVEPARKIEHLARVISKINDYLRDNIPFLAFQEKQDRPFQELESHLRLCHENGLEIESFKIGKDRGDADSARPCEVGSTGDEPEYSV